jgi:hypothetical protein
MLRKLIHFSICGAALAALALAQEGHPLTGSWHGDWGKSKTDRKQIHINMKWNNKSVEGTINPGRDGLPLKAAELNAEKWTVHIESQTKDGQPIVADGKMDDIGSYNRTITGTWTQGTTKGDFKLRRD